MVPQKSPFLKMRAEDKLSFASMSLSVLELELGAKLLDIYGSTSDFSSNNGDSGGSRISLKSIRKQSRC